MSEGDSRRAPSFSRAEERRLIAAARAGDRGAMDRLVTALSAPVFRYGRSFCGNTADAEDVMQDTLSAMVRGLAAFRERASLTTWAYVVARNACTRMRRHRRREVADAEGVTAEARDAAASLRSDPATAAERDELAVALAAAIRELPHTLREALVLRDVEGLSAAEAASVLRIGERALKSRLHRARALLRDRLASWAGRDGEAPHARVAGDRPASRSPLATKPRRGPSAATTSSARAASRSPAAAPLLSPSAGGAAGAARSCPDLTSLLSRHLEGELDASTCARLEAHVSGCPRCGTACQAFRETLALCRRSGHERPPLALRRAVRAAIRRALAEIAP